MKKKFATGIVWVLVIQSNYKYRVIYSFLIILPLISSPFHLSTVLVFRSLYTNLRYGYTREVVAGSEWSYYMVSSVNSMVLGHSQNGSTIELSFRRRYPDFLRLFSILGYILQSDWCRVFRILNYRSSLLCSVLSGFPLSSVFWLILGELSSMQYSGNSITKQWYRISIIWHRSKIYTAGSAEDIYVPIIIQSTWQRYS